jgi:beta-lactam-binding protein with PASTA domain
VKYNSNPFMSGKPISRIIKSKPAASSSISASSSVVHEIAENPSVSRAKEMLSTIEGSSSTIRILA